MHTKILFFLFTLWVGSTRIAQAHNFSSSLTYFNQVTQQVIAKHWHTIVPALKVGALIGIGALWYKMLAAEKHDAASVGLRGISEIISVENKDQPHAIRAYTQVTQLQVSRQGGDASCGYHALKNARETATNVQLLQTGEITEELKEKLQNAEQATTLFGPQGAWRKQVKEQRAQQKIRKDIYNYLKTFKKEKSQPVDFDGLKLSSKDTINYFLHGQMKFGQARKIAVTLANGNKIHLTIKLGNIISKIDTALDTYACYVVEQALKNGQKAVIINKNSLNEFLTTRYEFCKCACNFNKELEDGQTVQDEQAYFEYTGDQYEENENYSLDDCEYINKAITEFMQDPATLEQYINLNELKECTFSADQEQGDWLRDAEIESIIKHQQIGTLPITIIQNCTILGFYRLSSEKMESFCRAYEEASEKISIDVLSGTLKNDSEVYKDAFEKIAQNIKSAPRGYVHAFILGTMTQKETNGHWYTLVVHAKDGMLNYYVMDSLGINRVNDGNVIKVINELETIIQELA